MLWRLVARCSLFPGEWRLHAVRQLGRAARPAHVRSLIACLADEDGRIREVIFEAMKSQGAAGTLGLLGALASRNPQQRAAAASLLGRLKQSPSVVIPVLILRLDDTVALVRESAARSLGLFESLAQSAVEPLRKCLRDNNRTVTLAALESLGSIGSEAQSAIPQVIEALADSDPRLRKAAAKSLGAIGARTPEIVPELIQRLFHHHADVRAAAARALGGLEAAAKPAVPALIQQFDDQNVGVRLEAASAVARIVPDPDEILPSLLRLLQDKEWKIRERAIYALVPHGPRARIAVPALIALVAEPQGRVQLAALIALTEMGRSARFAARDVFELLLDRHTSLRDAARNYFLRVGPHLAELVPWLMEQLDAPAMDRRGAALQAIQFLGPIAGPSLAAVCRLIDDRDLGERAADTLGCLGAVSKKVIPALLERLTDSETRTRQIAARALTGLKAQIDSERGRLVHHLSDRDPVVRQFVSQALNRSHT